MVSWIPFNSSFQKGKLSCYKSRAEIQRVSRKTFLLQMKIFAALALVTLFCCLEVALGYPRSPVRQQQDYNALKQDTATAQQLRGLLKIYIAFSPRFCFFHAGFLTCFLYDNCAGSYVPASSPVQCCYNFRGGSYLIGNVCTVCFQAARM